MVWKQTLPAAMLPTHSAARWVGSASLGVGRQLWALGQRRGILFFANRGAGVVFSGGGGVSGGKAGFRRRGPLL